MRNAPILSIVLTSTLAASCAQLGESTDPSGETGLTSDPGESGSTGEPGQPGNGTTGEPGEAGSTAEPGEAGSGTTSDPGESGGGDCLPGCNQLLCGADGVAMYRVTLEKLSDYQVIAHLDQHLGGTAFDDLTAIDLIANSTMVDGDQGVLQIRTLGYPNPVGGFYFPIQQATASSLASISCEWTASDTPVEFAVDEIASYNALGTTLCYESIEDLAPTPACGDDTPPLYLED